MLGHAMQHFGKPFTCWVIQCSILQNPSHVGFKPKHVKSFPKCCTIQPNMSIKKELNM